MLPSKIVIVFRTRIIPGYDEELASLGLRMYELASTMPGFLSYKDFSSEDGENLSLVEFDSMENLAAWRNHPEHVAAQELGRARYFRSYQIQVCTVSREHSFAN